MAGLPGLRPSLALANRVLTGRHEPTQRWRSELPSRGLRKRCTYDGALNYVFQRCTNLADHGSVGNEGRGPAVRDLSFACVQVPLKRLFHRDHLGFMQRETPGLFELLLQPRTKALDCTTMGDERGTTTLFNFSLTYP